MGRTACTEPQCLYEGTLFFHVGSVQYIVSLFVSPCYFIITRLMYFHILFMFVFSFCKLPSISCILCCCIALCTVSPFVYSCLSPIFVQLYGPLEPGGNPIAVSHHVTCRDYSLHQGSKSKGSSKLVNPCWR